MQQGLHLYEWDQIWQTRKLCTPQHHRTVRFQRQALAGVEPVPCMLEPNGIAQVTCPVYRSLSVVTDTT